jgi:hypothetical protein
LSVKAHQMHHGKGRNHRQRQGGGGNQRRTPVTQKQPHHNDREDGALDQQRHRAVEILLHRVDKIEGLGDGDVGVSGFEPGQFGPHAVGHFDFARAAAPHNFEANHGLAIEQCCRALFSHGIGDAGHLIEPYAPAVGKHDVHARQFVGRLYRGNGAHRLLRPTHVGASA